MRLILQIETPLVRIGVSRSGDGTVKGKHENDTLYKTQGSGKGFKPRLVAVPLQHLCKVRYIDVLSGESRGVEFSANNPQGQLPYSVTKDGSGLGESNAIAWYLAEGSALMPDSHLDRAHAFRWMNVEQTKLEANISPVRFFTYIIAELEAEHKDMIPSWRERGNDGLEILDNYLQNNEYITDCGYSVADIAVYGYIHLANEGGFDLSVYANVSAWISRVQSQDGYRAIDRLLTGISDKIAA